MCCCGDGLDVEDLPSVVMHSGEEDERDGVAVGLNGREDVLIAQAVLVLAGFEEDDGGIGIVAVQAHLGFDQVAVGGERLRAIIGWNPTAEDEQGTRQRLSPLPP